MIRNDRQLAVAERKCRDVLRRAEEADEAGRSVYSEFANELAAEIDDYRSIRDGFSKVFKITSVDDLAEALVKARIARGWTHKQLADALGVTPQMVQRDEAGGYERAALARVADVAEVLGYELTGVMQPLTEQPGGSTST